MKILVTGGAGYIGSHTCILLLEAGHTLVVIDNLSNSKALSLSRVQEITGQSLVFVQADIRDETAMFELMKSHAIEAVIHFAGLKAVGESSQIPVNYYDNNVGGTLALLKAMQKAEVYNMIFSSSATVYGDPQTVPITEDFPLTATNPYGWSKLMVEQILSDLQASDPQWSVTLLRYFNPVGAHPSGLIGEDPNGIPNNLLPYIAQVAIGRLEKLSVFGDDYPTPDGTGVRDYIHVMDLAKGHLAALERNTNRAGRHVYNLGTGQGYSVLEMREAFAKACQREIPYVVSERRLGDIAECWADPAWAQQDLDWSAELGLEEMTTDAWRWQSRFPNGFEE